ncbi:MAG: S-ribosylhomocysteine lyase [Odoribacteraceae bacterium]|jgi:S-ribosylhomocysteine lyase|nr:S-ribosylhomocysteine lyase [Odoribacteraceae bacterium]
MEKIPSFNINHLALHRGIYVSRKDNAEGAVITTFDIRLKEPNREPVLGQPELHTIEHLAATYLRSRPDWQHRVIYWGPMGCCTGCYFLALGDLAPDDIAPLLRDTFRFIRDFDGDIPGAAPRDCGNYLLHNLPMARLEAGKFLRVLENLQPENTNYPD